MPYVYRYTDLVDGIIKYVGISRDKDALEKRFRAHKRDYWYCFGDWKVEYACFKSMSDVQFLEGVLIAKYGTGSWYNVAKTSWGESDLFKIPSIDWKIYDEKEHVTHCDTENQDLKGRLDVALKKLEQFEILKKEWKFERDKANKLEKNYACVVEGNRELLSGNSQLRKENKELKEEVESLSKKLGMLKKAMHSEEGRIAYKKEACASAARILFKKPTA